MVANQADARLVAWTALRAVEDGAFADAALARQLQTTTLEERDRGLATQLVYGTIAWQGLSDHVLSSLGRPAGQLDAAVRTLLRMALFQILKLERVPDFAVVDTAVELAKRHKRGAAGLVNALLREFLRRGKDPLLPGAGDVARELSISGSHPRWLVERWQATLGNADTEALLAANNQAAPTVLRVNRRRVDRGAALAALAAAGCEGRNARFAADAVEIDLRRDITKLEAFRAGWITPQGEASQIVGAMIPSTARTVLDSCAAPGGKATQIAERTAATVIAVDRARSGAAAIAGQAVRLGVPVVTMRADARHLPLRNPARFDAVLVDAPCSGLGTLRQHPEIRWRRRPEDIARLAVLQGDILRSAATHVSAGGVLVYATCTISTDENEHRIADFLAERRDFAIDDPRPELPEPARDLVGDDGFLRTFPHRHGLDGFFGARLKRR